MPEQPIGPQGFKLTNDLTTAVDTLDAALAQAGRAVADLAQATRAVAEIRSSIGQVASLAKVVSEMENAMDLARQSLGAREEPKAFQQPAPAPAPTPIPQPTPQPAWEPQATIQEPLPERTFAEEPRSEEPLLEPEPAGESFAPPPARAGSSQLRLGVSSRGGSLDLKAVDGSVNENPAVVDVALLDYDGRHATLKLWIAETADPVEVRDGLIDSLRRHLGDDDTADIRIDFEERSAA